MNENLYVETFTKDQIDKLYTYLNNKRWQFSDLQYAHWKASLNKTTVSAYNSGKDSIQGKGTKELVQFFIEPEITGEARFGYEDHYFESDSPEQLLPHCGIDESGKGGFLWTFGNLLCLYK